ncbi:MAG TPA: hypothetical protein PKK23_00320 [Nitrospirales bacterium]|nr:hypothetical protein [Nitrospiraceae bacterium]HNP27453.1 hypothetical protein [Nitrospirales bacterium]
MSTQFKKIMGYVLVVCLLIGFFVLYRYVQPTGYQLPDDPLALEALELVKKHRSRQGYTLDEAVQLLVDDLKIKGIPFREGDWQVAAQGEDKYVVRKIVREKGSVEWIEREYAWRVDSKERSIRVISLAAQQLMPFENLPPLPHGDQISSLSDRMEKIFPLSDVERSADGVLLT